MGLHKIQAQGSGQEKEEGAGEKLAGNRYAPRTLKATCFLFVCMFLCVRVGLALRFSNAVPCPPPPPCPCTSLIFHTQTRRRAKARRAGARRRRKTSSRKPPTNLMLGKILKLGTFLSELFHGWAWKMTVGVCGLNDSQPSGLRENVTCEEQATTRHTQR